MRRMKPQEIDDFFQIRELLETYAAPLIINRITSEEIEELREIIEKASAFLENGDYRNVVRLNIDFHEILWRSVNSELFFQVISGLSNMFIWYRALTARNNNEIKGSWEDHKKILRAIQKKNLAEFKRVLKRHIRHAKESNKIIHGLLFS